MLSRLHPGNQKKHFFYHSYIKKFTPRRFDKFAYVSSKGASGGLLTVWASSTFQGRIVHHLPYALTVEFTSTQCSDTWTLTNIYGPCDGQPRDDFVDWIYHLTIPTNENWIFMGDFNFIRSTQNRNRHGGNMNNITIFNNIISYLGLIELPVKGRSCTRSNMQENPLLEQLYWFFYINKLDNLLSKLNGISSSKKHL